MEKGDLPIVIKCIRLIKLWDQCNKGGIQGGQLLTRLPYLFHNSTKDLFPTNKKTNKKFHHTTIQA